jgi:hypothetical protein
MALLCVSVFSKTPKTVKVSELRRLQNPLKLCKDYEHTLWMNDEIVNAYLELLDRKYPRNESIGNNFFFNTFFMQQLMNLSKMSSLDGAGYNYGAVKNWVERKLLPKQIGKKRKYTEKGFDLFMTSAVIYMRINWGLHWIWPPFRWTTMSFASRIPTVLPPEALMMAVTEFLDWPFFGAFMNSTKNERRVILM